MALYPVKPLSSSGLPETLLLGAFTLAVESYTATGQYDPKTRLTTGVSGTAWVGFDCGLNSATLESLRPVGPAHLFQDYEVVAEVVHPQTEISQEMACRIQPEIQIGATLELDADIAALDLRSLVRAERGLAKVFEARRDRGDILVEFTEVTISSVVGKKDVGRISSGQAVYPTAPFLPKSIRLVMDGFVMRIDSLQLTPTKATGHALLQLPAGLCSMQTRGTAQLDLGIVDIAPDCRFYVERLKDSFGPWIVGDTSMVIEGKGFVLELNNTQSFAARPPVFRGLRLKEGTASGKDLVPEIANTAYLAANYIFAEAVITADGLQGAFSLAGPFDFQTSQPAGYKVHIEGGWLELCGSEITFGWLGPGTVGIPTCVACKDMPGNQLTVGYTHLEVRSNLDLAGVLDLGTGANISWGELTRLGAETMVWTVAVRNGYLWLPANPVASFDPEECGSFVTPTLSDDPASSLAELEEKGMAGLAFYRLSNLKAFSPDRPGGVNNPLPFPHLNGWLYLGGLGVSAAIDVLESCDNQELGEPARPGYLGVVSFDTTLFPNGKKVDLMRVIDSAVYDSQIDGFFTIGGPCKIEELLFTEMELTSTACLVGGKLQLPMPPKKGVTLDYWQLELVSAGDTSEAGVVSIRTGRVFFTAAGIKEPVHFDKTFNLIWGELLADGNIGEFLFDHNCMGQCFDKFSFTPHHVVLSKVVPNATDAYLAVYGSVHLNHFGARFINIQDARCNNDNPPYKGRLVTIPKSGEVGCGPTDLSLQAIWYDSRGNDLTTFDFPDAGMDYHNAAQNGFLGKGMTTLGFIHSNGLDAVIEIHIDAIDICLSSGETHNLDTGLVLPLGLMGEIHGCIRIEGPLLKRIAVFGCLEAAAATGTNLLRSKASYMVEVNLSITPNSLDFSAAGDLILEAAGAAVDVSAAVHLFVDWQRGSAEGEVQGRIDCNSAIAGLEGEGQVTWYIDSSTQYLQGKLAMEICCWTGGNGLEGGLFLGNNVPRTRAWVLYEGGERFGISDSILPQTLTGLYGYGQLKIGVQCFIFGGGVEIFLGVGCFQGEVLFSPPAIFGHCGVHVYGEILGGLVSAAAWADLALRGPVPLYFEGSLGLEGCIAWVLCASIEVTAGFNSDGFYLC